MKKRYILLLALLVWLLLAQSCMKFRMSDTDAKKLFAQSGVRFRIGNLKVNGRTLHYTVSGADHLPTLVFVHGSPGSWNAFEQFMRDPALLARFRMISVDRPGFGYSNFGDAVPLAEQSALLQTILLREENQQGVYLIGHSLGGPLIAQMSVDRPDYYKGLVLLAGSIDPAQETERWRPLFINTPLKFLVPGAMRPSNVELWYLKKDLKVLAPKLVQIKEPVMIIHGDKDRLVPYANMAFGQQHFTGSVRVDTLTITGADHFIPWSHYGIIRDVLLKL